MKIMLNGDVYEAKRIPAAMTRRAMELNVKALDAAAKAEKLKTDQDAGDAKALLELLTASLDEKVKLIVDTFEWQFSNDKLLEYATTAEINAMINQIAKG